MKLTSTMTAALLVLVMGGGCGGGGSDATAGPGADSAERSSLTPEELEKGIGPIRSVAFETVDAQLAARGNDVFDSKCSACHKFDGRYVGPSLGGVLDRRSPEFVMNMMLNPQEMLDRHPVARAMLAEYMTPMPFQSLTEDDARAVLEYFRIASSPNL